MIEEEDRVEEQMIDEDMREVVDIVEAWMLVESAEVLEEEVEEVDG